MFNLFFAILILSIFVIFIVKNLTKNSIKSYIWTWFIIIAILMIVNTIFFRTLDSVKVENPVKTEANILQLGEISNSYDENEFFILQLGKYNSSKQKYYKRTIVYSYVVNSIEYINSGIIKSTNRNALENINKNIIKIKYNEKNPNNSGIIKTNIKSGAYVDIVNIITISILIGLGIMIKIGSTPINEDIINEKHTKMIYKKNKKITIMLKVLRVDIIDYEREKVFFENQTKELYYYETDFGESFHENEQYEVKLNKNNRKRVKIEYEGQTVKAIKIINIEIDNFIKKK